MEFGKKLKQFFWNSQFLVSRYKRNLKKLFFLKNISLNLMLSKHFRKLLAPRKYS